MPKVKDKDFEPVIHDKLKVNFFFFIIIKL